MYKLYSELISQAIATGGANAARTTFVKYMRSVKKVALKLIETFVDKCDDPQLLASQYLPAMMDPLLGDYARSVPDARWVVVGALVAWGVGVRLPWKVGTWTVVHLENHEPALTVLDTLSSSACVSYRTARGRRLDTCALTRVQPMPSALCPAATPRC